MTILFVGMGFLLFALGLTLIAFAFLVFSLGWQEWHR